jgi:hypothetical protein
VHKLDLAAVLSTLVGISALAADSTFKDALTTLLGPQTAPILSALSIIGLVGGQVLRVVGSPSGLRPTVFNLSVTHADAPSAILATPLAPEAPKA